MDASDWMKGIFFSVLASVVGASSKLAIRKSWLMEEDSSRRGNNTRNNRRVHGEYQEPSLHQQQQRSNPNEPLEEGQPPTTSTRRAERQEIEEEPDPPQPARRRADSRSYYTAIRSSAPPSRNQRHEEEEKEGNNGESSIDDEQEDGVASVALEIESTPLPLTRRCCCTMPRFLRFSGMIGMTFLNPACCLLAMNYATPSILAPFSGLTLVWVVVFSRPLIGESPSCSQRIASTLIVVGEIMISVFGDHSNDAGTTKADVIASYEEFSFIAFYVIMVLWLVLLVVWMKYSKSPKLKRIAWGTSGGSITGLAQNFIKDSLVIAKASGSISQMPWYLFVFIFNGIAFSFGGLLFLTACMKRYDATYSAAMFVGSFVVSTSIMAASHYHTFEHLADVVDYIMYPMGLVILIIGVGILVQGTQAYTLESDPDDSDRIILTEGRYNAADLSEIDVDDLDDGDAATPVVAIDISDVASKATETTTTTSTRTDIQDEDILQLV